MGRASPRSSSAAKRRLPAGERLRLLRLACGFTLRDVQQASVALATNLQNDEFSLPASRLHEIETRSVVPSIHRLYTLASVYRYDMGEFLNWYGIPQPNGSKAPVSAASAPPFQFHPR